MKKRKFTYNAISGLIILSIILKDCSKPDQNIPTPFDHSKFPIVSISVSYVSDRSAVLDGTILVIRYFWAVILFVINIIKI
jgi:hypothetical protein